MLHSVSWLDIVGDKELCLQKRGAWVEGGGVAGVLTKHKLENLATRRSVIPA